MPFALEPQAALRAAAWVALLGVGLWVVAQRRDAAGRAFALWAAVWGGGVQLLLSVQAMATDAATQQLLYRSAYYAILFSTPAFLGVLVWAPSPGAQAPRLRALVLLAGVVAELAFALDHGAFLAERVEGARYVPTNAGAMQAGFPAAVWTGFLAGLVGLGLRAPRLDPAAQRSAAWLMAGLALFAADRFLRTAMLWVRDPATLGEPPEGWVFGLFMLALGAATLWMVARALPLPGARVVRLAALAGAAAGSTALFTFGLAGPAGIPVLVSALLGPAYGALLAKGVLLAPRPILAVAQRDRLALLSEA